MEKITMLHIGNTLERVDILPKLEEYYRVLDCDLIDIVCVQIAGRYYDIICDDEYLLRDGEKFVSAVNADGQPMLCGDLLVCSYGENADGEIEEKSLNPDDILRIVNSTQITIQGETVRYVVITE